MRRIQIKKKEDLEWKLRLLTANCRFFKDLSGY